MSSSKCKICGGPCGSVCRGLGFKGPPEQDRSQGDCKAKPELTGHSRKERRERVQSSDGGGESRHAISGTGSALRQSRQPETSADGVAPIPSDADSGAPQPRGASAQTKTTQPADAPKFDRETYHRNYMRDYMKRRRQAEKKGK